MRVPSPLLVILALILGTIGFGLSDLQKTMDCLLGAILFVLVAIYLEVWR